MPPIKKDIARKNPYENSSLVTWKKAWMASPGPISLKEHVFLFFKGIGMGTADIVPGVSGGTIALITGINGQDGSYLAEFLVQKNYEVHGIIRRSTSFNTSRIEHLFIE